MAIDLAEVYPGNAQAASADYPGGSFKNATGGGSDGTPLDQAWANNFLGFFEAILLQAGVTANGTPDTALASQYFEALLDIIVPVGISRWGFWSAPPVRHLELNGFTIGDASSGATARANADTAKLFTALWGLSPLKLYTSTGAEIARGASAAADFAAHRRIALPDMRGESPIGWDHGRGVDISRVLGSWKAGQVQAHTHSDGGAGQVDPHIGSNFTVQLAGGTGNSTGPVSGGNVGVENMVRGVAGMFVIRY